MFPVGITNTGKVRNHNEDFFLVKEDLGLYIVCDGMGGHNAGEIASQLACQTIASEIEKNKTLLNKFQEDPNNTNRDKVKACIDEAIQMACRKIYDQGQKNSGQKGMGTTMAMALFCGGNLFIAHAGDSRCYLFRESNIHQLTQDHSMVNEMLAKGIITKEQAENHPRANVITRALGIQEAVDADILVVEVLPHDVFCLCSDGLTKHLNNPELAHFLGHAGKDDPNRLQQGAQGLIKTTLDRGAHDNVTVIMLEAMKGATDIQTTKSMEAQSLAAKKLETLKKIPLFSDLNFQQLMKVLETIEVKSFNAGDLIIKEGEKGQEMYIVLSGKMQVFRENVVLNNLAPGAYFGEMALIDDAPRSATVKAMEKTKVIILEKKKFFTLLQSETAMANKVYWFFMQNLIRRLREKENKQIRLIKSDAAK